MADLSQLPALDLERAIAEIIERGDLGEVFDALVEAERRGWVLE